MSFSHSSITPSFNVPSVRSQFRRVLRDENCLLYRLRSIIEDSNWLQETIKIIQTAIQSHIPVYGNLRCGTWYLPPPPLFPSLECYFKSTDGHFGHWNFSSNRLNFHLLQALLTTQAIIIVDSTRLGKQFPDSFSRTIPIWCYIVNQVIYCLKKRFCLSLNDSLTLSQLDEQWENSLNMPDWINSSEIDQIKERSQSWINSFMKHCEVINKPIHENSTFHPFCSINKPLTPVWINRETDLSALLSLLSSYSDYIPLFLINPSKPEISYNSLGIADRQGWKYIQGAADDSENWSRGLTRNLFWENIEKFQDPTLDTEECEQIVDEIVIKHKEFIQSNIALKQQQNLNENKENHPPITQIGDSHLYVSHSSSLHSSFSSILPSVDLSSAYFIRLQVNPLLMSNKAQKIKKQTQSNNEQENNQIQLELIQNLQETFSPTRILLLSIAGHPKSRRSILDVLPELFTFMNKIPCFTSSNLPVLLISSNDLSFLVCFAAIIFLRYWTIYQSKFSFSLSHLMNQSLKFNSASIEKDNQKESEVEENMTKFELRQLINAIKVEIPFGETFPARQQLKQLTMAWYRGDIQIENKKNE
jgi:tRNA A64-2'-O-ribosylphosphate transferase